ncbi:MAG: hypothetical protein HXX18_03155 [Bacteroidetes bacterium]|nr:hypothetical protein [Bacteroidota bacterium]
MALKTKNVNAAVGSNIGKNSADTKPRIAPPKIVSTKDYRGYIYKNPIPKIAIGTLYPYAVHMLQMPMN